MPGEVSVETLTFEEHDGRTTLRSTNRSSSIEARDAMLQSGMEKGAAETYDRLEELLRAIADLVSGADVDPATSASSSPIATRQFLTGYGYPRASAASSARSWP